MVMQSSSPCETTSARRWWRTASIITVATVAVALVGGIWLVWWFASTGREGHLRGPTGTQFSVMETCAMEYSTLLRVRFVDELVPGVVWRLDPRAVFHTAIAEGWAAADEMGFCEDTIQKGFVDVWGEPLRVEVKVTERTDDTVVLQASVWSCGPNRRDDARTADDICSPNGPLILTLTVPPR